MRSCCPWHPPAVFSEPVSPASPERQGSRSPRCGLRKPGFAETLDQMLAVLRAQFVEIAQRQRHERPKGLAKAREPFGHHGMRFVDPPDLCQCSDQRIVRLTETWKRLAKLAGNSDCRLIFPAPVTGTRGEMQPQRHQRI